VFPALKKVFFFLASHLIPLQSYLFGNTKLLSCWAGEGIPGARTMLETLSRKYLGFAAIFFYGRWGLPIPYRIPVMGVMGPPIQTAHLKCEDPSMETVREVQKQLIDEMQALFDRHKKIYGWEHTRLTIK
jgi:hypothetical protein